MDLTRISTLLLGAWMGGCVFMDLVATQNFRTVDRLLDAPPAPVAARIQAMGGRDPVRALLRFQSSELNRKYFTTWEDAQLVLGVLVIFTLVAAGHRERVTLWLPALMLLVTLLMHFVLTPEITRLGRQMDFASPGAPAQSSTRFWMFHGGYSALELIKLGWGIALVVWLMLPKRKKPITDTATATQADPSQVA